MEMGLGPVWSGNNCPVMKHRWMFRVRDVSYDGVRALPPMKAGRPQLKFREATIEHVSEVVHMPTKAEWEPVELTLYDARGGTHPVFEWVRLFYDPVTGNYKRPDPAARRNCRLELYDGCGGLIQGWVFENAYPLVVDFGGLNMAEPGVATVDIRLRYDRAVQIAGL